MKTNIPDSLLRISLEDYTPRFQLLQEVAQKLEAEIGAVMRDVPRIDRIAFRAKKPLSYAVKSHAREADGSQKYRRPLEEIEDQVAGRILVFFRRDIEAVVAKLKQNFTTVEMKRKAPAGFNAFAYESDHLVLKIPPQAKPHGWEMLDSPPSTFEMQVRTLFMHAFAEPEHDISYKTDEPLTDDEKRRLAWAASNAWGGDAIFEQVLDSINARRARP